MPSNKASAGKRKGRDPELSQLLKLVLAKLGNDDDDSVSSDAASDNEVNEASSSRPRRSHVAPRVAFPPVKRRTKRRAPAAQPSTTVVPPLEQSPMPVTLVPSSSTMPELLGGGEKANTAPSLGVADVLADICGVPDRPRQVPDVTYKKKGTHTAASGIRYGRSLVICPELVRILW
ncbi:hypothetical protein NDU88_001639 [Pleurodeles waltl]|uniref:Uncharacterized protein n=1 Tax=Pleurodeles waltl TaxID=8319 RepID=A0AAV7LAC8_PLEWA|nr:hypothetical protein NDU88_001639 [Pleurodeles waltl]